MKRIKWNRIFVCLIIIGALFGGLYVYINNPFDPVTKELKGLNYSTKAIEKIKQDDVSKLVLDLGYSKSLEVAILDEKFNKENVEIYFNLDYVKDVNFIEYTNQLISIGYNANQVNNIFKYLNISKVKKIMKHSYVPDITSYISFEYFDINLIDNYINYKTENITYEDCITYVNIGLDNKFYTNIKVIENPDDLFTIVNKYNKLPTGFVPKNLTKISVDCATGEKFLVKDAAEAFEKMCAEIATTGLTIKANSAYRSEAVQIKLYNDYVQNDSLANADTYSARPGHSEHQLGLAVDIGAGLTGYNSFEFTDAFKWVKDNAHRFGYIMRYHKETEHITGYMYEPWHYRYLGIELATKIYQKNITYDEYLAKLKR